MTKAEKAALRREALLPNGIPRWIRCYDNGGGFETLCTPCRKFFDKPKDGKCPHCGNPKLRDYAGRGSGDRYTVCFTGKAGSVHTPGYGTEYAYLAMSARPCHPQGIGLWCNSRHQPCDTIGNKPGWHWAPAVGRLGNLGLRIEFADLPDECRNVVLFDYKEIWGLLPPRKEGA